MKTHYLNFYNSAKLTSERSRDSFKPPATGGAAIIPEGRPGLLTFADSTKSLGKGVVFGTESPTPVIVPSKTVMNVTRLHRSSFISLY